MSLDELRAKLNQPSVPDEEPSEEPEVKSEEGEAPVEAEKPEVDAEAPEAEAEAEEPTVEKDPPRIPYSRFESVNEARIRAEEELRLFKQREEQERLARAAAPTDTGLPAYWVKLYGDSPESKEAYALRQQELAEMRESLEQGVRQSILQEQRQAEERTEELVSDWSAQIDEFAATQKRKFTDAETDSILDVMDELTPKDEDGNYLVEPIQYLTSAVELYDLRTEKANAAKKVSKQQATKLVGAKSEGSLITPAKEWTGDWRSKLGVK